MNVWFVTPAWQRFELSAVCFDQRVQVIEALAAQGIETQCVVVADDDNLDLARARGFATVERDNQWLGRKFNDGMEYAAEHGATWIVPIGSDSWIDPMYFLPLPPEDTTRSSLMYCAVTADRMVDLRVRSTGGVGPYMLHRDLLAPSGFRPAVDEITRHVDSSTLAGIGGEIAWKNHDLHPYQYIGFRGSPHITSYQKLKKRWGYREHLSPWPLLARYYPADLVSRARSALLADKALRRRAVVRR